MVLGYMKDVKREADKKRYDHCAMIVAVTKIKIKISYDEIQLSKNGAGCLPCNEPLPKRVEYDNEP